MDDKAKKIERLGELKRELAVAKGNCERKRDRLQMFSRVKRGPQYIEPPKARKEQEESLRKEVAECERKCASLEREVTILKNEIDDETDKSEEYYLS